MNRSTGVVVAETSNPEQERFIEAILKGAATLRQSQHDSSASAPSVYDREATARLRELRFRGNAHALAFGHRE